MLINYLKNDLYEKISGIIRYILHPGERKLLTSFTKQSDRKLFFKKLMDMKYFNNIIETGTYLGGTLDYFHKKSKLPILSVEMNKKYYGYSVFRFLFKRKVRVFNDDSCSFLNKIAQTEIKNKPTFFYLDAHWHTDLPLLEEIKIINLNWREYVILIDDFQVPDEPLYEYDQYKDYGAINLELINSSLDDGMLIYFPSLSTEKIKDKYKGWVILCKIKTKYQIQFDKIKYIRRYKYY